MNRRDFLRQSARQAGAAAVPLAAAAVAGGSDLYAKLSDQVGETTQRLKSQIGALGESLSAMSGRVDTLELKYRIVMALLVLSMLVDGGMSWMLLTAASPLPIA